VTDKPVYLDLQVSKPGDGTLYRDANTCSRFSRRADLLKRRAGRDLDRSGGISPDALSAAEMRHLGNDRISASWCERIAADAYFA
jgi:hypothetical protein